MKNAKKIAEIKKDLDRCIIGDLAKHNKVGIIVTALVKKLHRVQKGVDISDKVFYSRFKLNDRRGVE